jgi:hypothetical protein
LRKYCFMSTQLLGGPKRGALHGRCAGGAGDRRGSHLQTETGLSYNTVGAHLRVRPNPRPPAGHCEERSDVAIRSPRPH